MQKKKFGDWGEELAANLLTKRGYKILDKKFSCKLGEIDIIAIDPSTGSEPDGTLVFVEVKSRYSQKYGKPEEAVTPRKLTHIKRTAQYYLRSHRDLPKKLRIDVVAIEKDERGNITAKIIKVV